MSLYLFQRSLLISFGFFLIYSSNAQEILWEKSYGGTHSEYLFDAIPTADYGFILAGSSSSDKSGTKDSHSQGDLDYWIWKMDEHGDLDWQRSFGGTGSDRLHSILATNDGGYILAGTSDSPKGGHKKEDGYGQDDFWIIKLNASGGEEWQKTIGGSGQDMVTAIRAAQDGGYIIGGSSASAVSGLKTADHYGSLDYWVVKLSDQGTIEWQKTYGGRYVDKLESIEPTQDGGYLIGGHSNSPMSGNKSEDSYGEGDYWVLKVDDKGEIEWQRTFGGEQDDHLFVVKESINQGYYVGGSSRSEVSGNKDITNGKGADFWILKLTENGEIEWQETYDFGQNDLLTTLNEQSDGTLLIGGQARTEKTGLSSSDSEGIEDYIALKITDEGEELWRHSVGSSSSDNLRVLVETRDGGYLFAGTSFGKPSRDKNGGLGLSDFWVVKLRDKDKEEKARVKGLEAFPNPVNAYTNIVVNHDFEEGMMWVFDINGRMIQELSIESRLIPLNLHGLASGIYIVNVKTDVKNESIKILKK